MFGYELQLRNDLNTAGHTQWYYFQVKNMIAGCKYTFSITNLTKPKSLYNQGMKPLFYSEYLAEHEGIGWHRYGTSVCYYKNTPESVENSVPTYTLCFTVIFPGNNNID